MSAWLDSHVLHEHQDFLVFSKPANIGFHSEEETLGFFELAKRAYCNSNENAELYPVHRLDKITSGLLLVAKNKRAAAEFGRMFEQHEVEKYYVALADAKPKKKQGTVKGDMKRGRRSSWLLAPTMTNPAITCFKSVALPDVGSGMRLFLLQPRTGKTHQLRVMMKSLGAAIVGDTIYADQLKVKQADRGYLHAFALKFEWNGKTQTFCLPPNEGGLFLQAQCQQMLETWSEPWLLPWPK